MDIRAHPHALLIALPMALAAAGQVWRVGGESRPSALAENIAAFPHPKRPGLRIALPAVFMSVAGGMANVHASAENRHLQH